MFAYMKQKPGFYKQVVLLALPIVLQNLITSALGMAAVSYTHLRAHET